ncbi:MAG TPA: hypothetical protein VHC97_25785 [Thermoanaerobaculia bacterium]|nr:hypothetical protein [Thermoanaerobaculia bacterium]
MRHRSMDNPVPRNLGHGTVYRKMTVEVIRERLHTPEPETGLRKVSELLDKKQRLQDQPWRRPRRPGAESASTMELIRRFEARLKAH